MEFSKNDKRRSRSEEQKWSKDNSLLYLFIDYVLPLENQNYSSVDINKCAGWLLSGSSREGTAFETEIKNKLEPMLKMLLEADNNVNFANRLDETVLRVFLSKYANNSTNTFKDQEMIEALMRKGASVDAIDKIIGYTPLQYAATIQRPDLVQLMLDNSDDLNARNYLGHTVLHLLLYNYEQHPSELHLEITRNLLSKGAYVNAKNKKGLTPVNLALQSGLVKVLLIFIEHGVNLDDYIGNDSNLLLHLCKNIAQWTRSAEELEALHRLMDVTQYVNCRSMKFNLAPLHFVSQVDRPDVVEAFLKVGADVNATSVDGITPLHLAVLQGSLAMVEYLIQSGADVDAREEIVGFGLMHMAVLSGDKDKVNLLIENGFDVNVRSNHGLTPFHVAVLMADKKMLKCLIERSIHFRGTIKQQGILRLISMEIDCTDTKILIGADENIGEMSLISQYVKSLDVSTTYLEALMLLLLEAGANINARDSSMKSALHYATLQKQAKLDMLLCLGAHVDAKDSDGKLPLQNALDCGNLMRGPDELLRFGANLNDVAGSNFYEWDKNIRYRLYNYLIELEVVDLPISDSYKRRLRRHFSGTSTDNYRDECQEEVLKLKNYYLTDSKISLYDFLHMDSRRRLFFARTVLSLDLAVKFPIYGNILEGYCRESINRSLLMKQAGSIFCQITGVNLPEICTNNIFHFLHNENLINVIDSFDVIIDADAS